MRKYLLSVIIVAAFSVPNIASAKDMAGTLVKCVTKRVTFKESGDSIIVDSSAPNYKLYSRPQYIAITKDQKFVCAMGDEAMCSDKKYAQFSYKPIPNNETGAYVNDDYYYVDVSKLSSTKITRDGSMFYIENKEEKRHGYCTFIADINF